MIYDLGSLRVQTVGDEFFVAPSAAVIGRVHLGRDASMWFGAVLRGDGEDIRIGDRSNVQDNAVIHIDSDAPTTVGHDVTIGHSAVVHGCTVGDFTLIGIGATILSHAKIGNYCLVGARRADHRAQGIPGRLADHRLAGAPRTARSRTRSGACSRRAPRTTSRRDSATAASSSQSSRNADAYVQPRAAAAGSRARDSSPWQSEATSLVPTSLTASSR